MKAWKAVIFMAALFLLSGCSKNTDKAFENLKSSLAGHWKSARSIEVSFDWKVKEHDLLGRSYSLVREDTLFLKKFRLYRDKDTLFMQLSEYTEEAKPHLYYLEKTFFGKYTFKAKNDIYPFYVIFDLKDDGWEYIQTNKRGNKEIGFYFIQK